MKPFVITLLALLLISTPLLADAADPGQTLSVRTFQLRHKQAEKAAGVIKPFMSAEGSMSMQASNNALVVTDLPENMKRIASALADFDAAAQSLQLSIRLVSAGRGAEARVARDLSDIAPKLALLRYNTLDSVGAADVNGQEGEPGLVDLNGFRADFRFGEYDPASDSVQLNDFRLLRREGDQLSQVLKTTLNLKLGQTVILGATRQPDSQRALMIVITAKR
jgi:hypothetical protein